MVSIEQETDGQLVKPQSRSTLTESYKVRTMAQKQCFVISPIDAEGSDVRKHADYVLDYIISPAMSECGIEAFRADKSCETGRISDHMFDAILGTDLCIAVLTFYNPNVFYEMAVAQAATRPVIIMLEKGNTLPFDTKDLRCVYYDFDLKAVMEGQYKKQLMDHVRSLEAANWSVKSIFGDRVPVVAGKPGLSGAKFYEKSDDFGTPDAWLQLLQESNSLFDIMGITLASWKRGKGFSDALLKKADEGCKIRVLLMHKDNPALPCMINDVIPEVDFDSVVYDIDAMYAFFSKLAGRNSNIEVRQVTRGCPHFQMSRTDQRALSIQYLFSQKTGWSPLWEASQGSAMYTVLTEEYDVIWEANKPVPDSLS